MSSKASENACANLVVALVLSTSQRAETMANSVATASSLTSAQHATKQSAQTAASLAQATSLALAALFDCPAQILVGPANKATCQLLEAPTNPSTTSLSLSAVTQRLSQKAPIGAKCLAATRKLLASVKSAAETTTNPSSTLSTQLAKLL